MLSEAERQDLRDSLRTLSVEGRASEFISTMRKLTRDTPKPVPDAMFCASLLEKAKDALAVQTGARRLKTFVVRSVTLEPILPFFKNEAALNGLLLEIEAGGYGSYVDEMLNPESALARFAPDLTFVILELEDVAGGLPELCADGSGRGVDHEIDAAIARLEQMLHAVLSHTPTRLVVQGFVVPARTSLGDVAEANLTLGLERAVGRINERLAATCRALPDCVFFDVDRVAARFGRARWSDTRLFLSSRLAVSADAFGVYARGLARSASALYRAPRKVLCTDLDNTLWGGILGEDGPEGIATGSTFPGNCFFEYQRFLKQLAARGILLAAVSKNNEADVVEAFELRAADLALTLNDFVAKKIGWNDKADSLRQLAQELSLGLDSFVFIDDNPVECEAIRRALPEVAVIAVPVEEPWKLIDLLAEQPFFDTLAVTEDDVNRTQDYRAQAERAQLETSASNRNEFLASLGIVCTFIPVHEAPLARAVQLMAKTNQFNLTTRRHSTADVERFASSKNGHAIAVRVRDRFGDAGVVGLALAETTSDTCRIDSLLLSCRVIGRGVETALLAEVAARAQRAGARRLIGEYIPTRKNNLCANFYTEHGFKPSSARAEPDSTSYEFDLTTGILASPAWLRLEGTENYELATGAGVTS